MKKEKEKKKQVRDISTSILKLSEELFIIFKDPASPSDWK